MNGFRLLLLAFGFTSPLLLWGLALAGIPILIHLLRRHRHREEPWAAMQFLRDAVRCQTRRLRLESLVLLAVRMLLIAFVAAALAQPYVETPGSFGAAEPPTHRILVVDASLSMGYQPERTSAFDDARQVAERIVESSAPGDAFHLVRISGAAPYAVVRRATQDHADILDELRRLPLTEERGDVLGALRSVEPLLKQVDSAARREIYLLSDFQQTNWQPEREAARLQLREVVRRLADQARLNLIDLGRSTAENVAVTDLRPLEPLAMAGRTAGVEATVRNFGRTPLARQTIEFVGGERVRDTRLVDLPPDTDVTLQFSVPVEEGGDLAVAVRVADDGLQADNRRWLVLPVRERLNVLLVSGRRSTQRMDGATDFVQLALAPGDGGGPVSPEQRAGDIVPDVIHDGELLQTNLARYECVFLCDVPLVTAPEAEQLETFVRGGGGLIVALGAQVRADSYNESLFHDGQGLLPAKLLEPVGESLAGGFRFDPGGYEHPLIRAFAGNADAGLATTLIDRYYRTEVPADSPAEVALRFSSGEPAIVERAFGEGRVILVTTTLDDRWGHWALWPSYVPMIHEMTWRAVAASADQRRLAVGRTLERNVPARAFDVPAALVPPQGEPMPAFVADSEAGVRITTAPLARSGVYELRLGSPLNRVERYAVNVDANESDLAPLEEAALSARLLEGVKFRRLTDFQAQAVTNAADGTQRSSLSRWLLAAALCLALVEQLMAWNFTAGFLALYGLVSLGLLWQTADRQPVVAAFTALLLLAGLGVPLARRIRSHKASSRSP
jgi:hypothetical protein